MTYLFSTMGSNGQGDVAIDGKTEGLLSGALALKRRRKMQLGVAGFFLLVYNFAGFAPATEQYIETGEWHLDPFYMKGMPYDVDFTILNHHAHLGLLFIGFATIQVVLGSGWPDGWIYRGWTHRKLGYAVALLAVLVVTTGAISEIQDAIAGEPPPIFCLHLLAGTMGVINLYFAIRTARCKQYMKHAEYIIYMLFWIGYPGEGRVVGFLAGHFVPCSIHSFSGFACPAQILNACLVQLIIRGRGSRVEAPRALMANTAVFLSYAALDALQAIVRGNFWTCPEKDPIPEVQSWWMIPIPEVQSWWKIAT